MFITNGDTMTYSNIELTTNRILIDGNPHVEWCHVENGTDIFPGRLVKKGTNDMDIVASTAGCTPLGWIGFQHTRTTYRPDGINSQHLTDDECALLTGQDLFITTDLALGESVSKGDPLSAADNGMVRALQTDDTLVAYAWKTVDATSEVSKIPVKSAI